MQRSSVRYLDSWEEASGRLISIKNHKDSLILELSKSFLVELGNDSKLARKLRSMIGMHVSILKTDEGYKLRIVE